MASYFCASPTFITIPKFKKPSAAPLAVSVSSRRGRRSSAAVLRPRALCGTNEDSPSVNSPSVTNLAVRTTAPPLIALARSTTKQADDLEPFGSDSDILDAVKKEIRVTEEGHVNQVKEIRDEFHFKIYEEQASEFITLRRSFRNETIEVEVYLQDVDDDAKKLHDDDDDAQVLEVDKTTTSSSTINTTSTTSSSEDQEEESKAKKIDLKDEEDEEEEEKAEDLHMEEKTKLAFTVTVTKGEGKGLIFSCIGDEDDFTIEDMYLDVKQDKEEGEDDVADEGYMFNDLSWDLQKGFYKYLERRGISPSTVGFLQDYLLNKERHGYLEWLHNMKQFIEN